MYRHAAHLSRHRSAGADRHPPHGLLLIIAAATFTFDFILIKHTTSINKLRVPAAFASCGYTWINDILVIRITVRIKYRKSDEVLEKSPVVLPTGRTFTRERRFGL